MKRVYVVFIAVVALLLIAALRPISAQQPNLYKQVEEPNPMRFDGKQMERMEQEEIEIVQREAYKQYVRK
jgi:hypothetical protein